ncbi:MAG: iron ABC transporter permease [Clostridiaceae bacterium]|nr:iron ABC transporter permease [Clostridiaceae bacterium]
MNDSIQRYKKNNTKYLIIGIVFLCVLWALLICMVSLGAMNISLVTTRDILFAKLTGNQQLLESIKPNMVSVIWDIRLPRIICGICVGMGLSIAGTIFQSLLQNPLADPYTLGVSTGAAFGASLAIFMNIMFGIIVPIPLLAFIFAFITLVLVIIIASRGGGMLSSNLIIAGIIVSAILSSGISFIKMIAGENVSAIVFWLMGSLSSRSWRDVMLVLPVVCIAGTAAFLFSNDLNVMTMGDKNATTLGVNTKRLRLLYLILGSCITAACVSVCGIIGFIGLIVPHMLRFWFTSDNRVLIPLSALMGGMLLSIADNGTRLFTTSEIPVGVLTTLIGGPFFIYIFVKRRKGGRDE